MWLEIGHPCERVRIELGRTVQAVNSWRITGGKDKIIPRKIQPCAQADHGCGRFSRSPSPRHQHTAVWQPYRRGMGHEDAPALQPSLKEMAHRGGKLIIREP